MDLVVIIYLAPGSEYSMAREMEGGILSMRRPNNHLKYLMLNICGFAAEVRCSEATQRYLQLKMSSTRIQLAREPHQPTDQTAASNIQRLKNVYMGPACYYLSFSHSFSLVPIEKFQSNILVAQKNR